MSCSCLSGSRAELCAMHHIRCRCSWATIYLDTFVCSTSTSGMNVKEETQTKKLLGVELYFSCFEHPWIRSLLLRLCQMDCLQKLEKILFVAILKSRFLLPALTTHFMDWEFYLGCKPTSFSSLYKTRQNHNSWVNRCLVFKICIEWCVQLHKQRLLVKQYFVGDWQAINLKWARDKVLLQAYSVSACSIPIFRAVFNVPILRAVLVTNFWLVLPLQGNS